jgi:hypothetical protein
MFLSAISLRAEGGFRFLVWGDATDLLPYVVTNAAQIRQLSVPPSFDLFAGDLYDTGFSLAGVEALKSAMDGGSSNGLSGSMFPVRGNHDIIGGATATTGWQSYFDVAERVAGGDPSMGVPGIGGSNYTYLAGCDSLTYSFDYQNSHFVGLDVPGDVTLVTASQLTWLDADLAAAEGRDLQHAFLWWHGPVYSCGSRHGGIDAPASMIAVLNKHPIVSAVFGGHAHVAAWTHMDTNRIASITHPFEAFIVSAVAEGLASLPDTNRCDYGFGDVRGFATVDVHGPAFTVSFYVQDEPAPRFTWTFPSAPVLSSPALLPNRQFQFILNGELGHRYRIESSANLATWSALSTNTVDLPQGLEISDLMPTDSTSRFYRGSPVP